MIDTTTHRSWRTCPPGPIPSCLRRIRTGKILYVANEDANTVTIIDLEKRVPLGEVQVGVEPEGGHQPGRQDPGQHLRDDQHGAFHRHRHAPDRRQRAGRCAARFAEFKRDGSEVWVSSEVGGTVSIIDPVKREVTKKITFDIPGLRKEAIQPVGISLTKDGKTGFVAPGLPTASP